MRMLPCLLLVIWTGFLTTASAQDFTASAYSTGWIHPTSFAFDASGHLYVAERHGYLFQANPDGSRPTAPLLDISHEVGVWNDHGLMSITLDPDFLTNGYVYLLYVVNRHHLLHVGTPSYQPGETAPQQATIGRLTRYMLDASTGFTTVVPESRRVLVGKTIDDGFPIMYKSHGVGAVAFAEDGSLLVSCGDGAAYNGVDDGGDDFGSFAPQGLSDGMLHAQEDVGAFRAQLIDSHNGKLLRIDPKTGDGLPGNPFFDPAQPATARSRVFALGFRSPYRFAVQPGTGGHSLAEGNPGLIWVGDIGWYRWEELNRVDAPGLNFGWPLYEGMSGSAFENHRTAHPRYENPLANCPETHFTFQDLLKQPLADPALAFPNPCDPTRQIPDSVPTFVHQWPAFTWPNVSSNKEGYPRYPHELANGEMVARRVIHPDAEVAADTFRGTCIIAGAFAGDVAYPREYHGALFVADFSGFVKIVRLDTDHQIEAVDSTSLHIDKVIQISQHPLDGHLYALSYASFKILKIEYGGNLGPKARLESDLTFGDSPLRVAFDASASADPEGDTLQYHWDFGDGAEATGVAPTHEFVSMDGSPKSYLVTLTVTDAAGKQGTAYTTISLNNTPPQVRITSPQDSSRYSLSGVSLLPLQAEVEDQEHRAGDLDYRWRARLHHNTHFHPEPVDTSRASELIISPEGCNGEVFYYEVELEVTDAAGLSGSDTVWLFPNCSPPMCEWEDLQAQAVADGIAISWRTAAEATGLQFQVQRATDPIHFREIGGQNGGKASYRHLDPAPRWGENYYRIAAIRSDGYADYSPVITAVFPATPQFLLTPNPVEDHCQVWVSQVRGAARFRVLNRLGQPVISLRWEAPATDFQAIISLASLVPGVYHYEFRDAEHAYRGSLIKR